MRNTRPENHLRRRDVLKYAAWTVGGASISSLASCSHRTPGEDRPLFSFVQLNDTHLMRPEDKGGYSKTTPKINHVIATINAERDFPLPDFVILTGDIIHGGELELLLPQCAFAKETLAALRCPYYTVVGNHEVVQREGHPEYQGPYEQVFGKDRVNYDFVHKGIHFVCLNNANGIGDVKAYPGDSSVHKLAAEVTPKRNQWLAEALDRYPKLPKIVACHIPLACLREEPVLKKSFGFPTYQMIGSGTWDIVRAHNRTVVAVICGHLHLTGTVETDGIHHVCPSGTASYPCHYARYVVYRDRVEVHMIQVAEDLVTPNTNLHGKPRYPEGFTDVAHPTAEEYVSGTAAERRFAIPLLRHGNS